MTSHLITLGLIEIPLWETISHDNHKGPYGNLIPSKNLGL